METWTLHQINLIAKCLGYSNDDILYNTGIVERRSLYSSTPRHPQGYTPTKPPMALYTLVPPQGGNYYYVYINGRLAFCYYEKHNKYIAYN